MHREWGKLNGMNQWLVSEDDALVEIKSAEKRGAKAERERIAGMIVRGLALEFAKDSPPAGSKKLEPLPVYNDSDKFTGKINEIISAVNELRGKA